MPRHGLCKCQGSYHRKISPLCPSVLPEPLANTCCVSWRKLLRSLPANRCSCCGWTIYTTVIPPHLTSLPTSHGGTSPPDCSWLARIGRQKFFRGSMRYGASNRSSVSEDNGTSSHWRALSNRRWKPT